MGSSGRGLCLAVVSLVAPLAAQHLELLRDIHAIPLPNPQATEEYRGGGLPWTAGDRLVPLSTPSGNCVVFADDGRRSAPISRTACSSPSGSDALASKRGIG